LRAPARRTEPAPMLQRRCGIRELAEPEEIRHVLERRRAREIADLVPAIEEPPRLAVHLTDRRPRRDDVLEPRLPLHTASFELAGPRALKRPPARVSRSARACPARSGASLRSNGCRYVAATGLY